MNASGSASAATRSQYVFAASDIVSNRFQLCALAAKTSRRLARNLKGQPENINQALQMIADGVNECGLALPESPVVASPDVPIVYGE
jgi:hypothetical protein